MLKSTGARGSPSELFALSARYENPVDSQHNTGYNFCFTTSFANKVSWMPFYFFQWTGEAIQHIAEHGVTQDEFTEVVMDARVIQTSRSTG